MNKTDGIKMKVSPNSPVAAQIIEDKVVDMLIFLALRHFHIVSKESEVEKKVSFETQ